MTPVKTQSSARIVRKKGSISIIVPAGITVAEPIILHESGLTKLSVHVGAGASVTIVTLTSSSASTTIVQEGTVGKDASIHWFNVTLGSGSEQSLVSTLTGSGARSTIDWIFFARGNEHQSIGARNIFLAPGGGGEITIKGVAEDKAHVACNGKLEIGPHGNGTQTYLTENILMLDPTARVDAVPGLEIKTNDVKASHSATISRITDEDLFYFAARGISKQQARQMFIEGFLLQLVDRITNEKVRGDVRDVIINSATERTVAG